jgi:hypothetical protein
VETTRKITVEVLRIPTCGCGNYGTWIGFLRRVFAATRQRAPGSQVLIDRGIPLLTRDRDFRSFAEAAGLNLVIG